jgi:hypothetical protein
LRFYSDICEKMGRSNGRSNGQCSSPEAVQEQSPDASSTCAKEEEEEEDEEDEDEDEDGDDEEEDDERGGEGDGGTSDDVCENKEGGDDADIADGEGKNDGTNRETSIPENGEEAQDGTAASEDDGEEERKEAQHLTPETLRKELRMLAMERDRTLSVLQKKLREKNDEFHNLMKLRESRAKSIVRLEAEKRDREEWARSRRGDVDETFLSTSREMG